MGVNDGPHRRLHRVLLLVGIGIIAKQNARMQREVLGGKIGDHCARPGIERVVRSAQIGEFGIATPARRDQCMQHRNSEARNLGLDAVDAHAYPHSSGGFLCDMRTNQELDHDAAEPQRLVARLSEDGDGVRGAIRDRGGLSSLLDRGSLGQQADLRPLREHARVERARWLPVRVCRVRASDEPHVRHVAGEDAQAFQDVVPRGVRDLDAPHRHLGKDLQRIMGFGSYKTAWSWLHKLRAAMVRSDSEPLGPFVQLDEALVGGKGGPHKELVLVAAEANGRVRLAHAGNNASREPVHLTPISEAVPQPIGAGPCCSGFRPNRFLKCRN